MDIKKRIPKIFSNLIIILFLMIFFRSQFDQDSSLIKKVYTPLNPIQKFFSLYQNWYMFAPNPSRINSFISAEIEYEDGETLPYTFYRPSREELFQRYFLGERFRKFFTEGIRLDRNSHLWPDLIAYIKREVEKQNPHKKIKKISLRRHWNTIGNWEESFVPFTEDIPLPYQEYLFYSEVF